MIEIILMVLTALLINAFLIVNMTVLTIKFLKISINPIHTVTVYVIQTAIMSYLLWYFIYFIER